MLTRSTPAAWSSRAASIVRSMRIERGGSISTEMTKRPSRRALGSSPVGRRRLVRGRARRCADDRRCAGCVRRAPRDGPLPRCASGRERVERRAHRGDVLRRRAAAAADDRAPRRRRTRADHVGRSSRVRRRRRTGPRCAAGRPAFGHDRAAGAVARRPIRVSASRQPAGPAPQLTPMTSTSARSSAVAAAATGVVPSRQPSSSPNVSDRDDRQVGGRAARLLDRDRARSLKRRERLEHEEVDAALEQAVDLLAEAARTAASSRSQHVRAVAGPPSGPTEPGDQHVATGDVARLAGDLGAPPVRAGRPGRPARTAPAGCRLAPNVAVSMMSAPASRYSRWMAPIRSGRVATSSSRQARCGMPRLEQERAHRPVGQERRRRRGARGTGFEASQSRRTAYRAG